MAGGNRCLEMEPTQLRSGSRVAQMKHSARNDFLIPPRAVLLAEKKHISLRICACRQPRGIEMHQRRQRVDPGDVPHWMVCEEVRQADCFVTEFLPNKEIAMG